MMMSGTWRNPNVIRNSRNVGKILRMREQCIYTRPSLSRKAWKQGYTVRDVAYWTENIVGERTRGKWFVTILHSGFSVAQHDPVL